MDTWQLIAAERARLADALDGVRAEDWAAPSLVQGWRNSDALAHIVATIEKTQFGFFSSLARAGFSFDKMVATDIARISADGVPAMLTRLRDGIDKRDHPPGPTASWLLEMVIHGEDIAYGLPNVDVKHTPDGLVAAAQFAKTAQPLIGVRKRIAGLRLRATDFDWSTGDGPEVSGALVPLLLAMCGRRGAHAALTGDGVAVLAARP